MLTQYAPLDQTLKHGSSRERSAFPISTYDTLSCPRQFLWPYFSAHRKNAWHDLFNHELSIPRKAQPRRAQVISLPSRQIEYKDMACTSISVKAIPSAFGSKLRMVNLHLLSAPSRICVPHVGWWFDLRHEFECAISESDEANDCTCDNTSPVSR